MTVSQNIENAVVRETIFRRVCSKYAGTVTRQSAILGSDPKITHGGFGQAKNPVAVQPRVVAGIKNSEIDAIKSRKPAMSSKPEIAIPRLKDLNIVLRKSIFGRP